MKLCWHWKEKNQQTQLFIRRQQIAACGTCEKWKKLIAIWIARGQKNELSRRNSHKWQEMQMFLFAMQTMFKVSSVPFRAVVIHWHTAYCGPPQLEAMHAWHDKWAEQCLVHRQSNATIQMPNFSLCSARLQFFLRFNAITFYHLRFHSLLWYRWSFPRRRLPLSPPFAFRLFNGRLAQIPRNQQ